jgi:hypothetical protein
VIATAYPAQIERWKQAEVEALAQKTMLAEEITDYLTMIFK